jgi:NRPS condensation-like uncharacterized protein
VRDESEDLIPFFPIPILVYPQFQVTATTVAESYTFTILLFLAKENKNLWQQVVLQGIT